MYIYTHTVFKKIEYKLLMFSMGVKIGFFTVGRTKTGGCLRKGAENVCGPKCNEIRECSRKLHTEGLHCMPSLWRFVSIFKKDHFL